MIENTREIYESLYPRIFNQHYGMCSEEFNRPFDYFAGYDYLVSIIEEKDKEIEKLNNILIEIKKIINNKYWFNWEYENDEVIKEVLEKIEGVDKEWD